MLDGNTAALDRYLNDQDRYEPSDRFDESDFHMHIELTVEDNIEKLADLVDYKYPIGSKSWCLAAALLFNGIRRVAKDHACDDYDLKCSDEY